MSLVDAIKQVRRQYVKCGRPTRPKAGRRTSEEYKEWENMAKRTINRNSIREVLWLIFASKELYLLWRKICNKWLEGELPDGNGHVIGENRDSKAINVGMFRCLEGGLTDTEIKMILEKVDHGDALLKKFTNCEGDYVSMEHIAKTTKMLSRLKLVIIDYYQQHFHAHFPVNCAWEDVSQKLQIDSEELLRCKEAATVKYLSSFIPRNIAQHQTLPHLLVSRLNHLFHEKSGQNAQTRLEPFVALFSDNLMVTWEPLNTEEASPCAPLAIVDFGKMEQREWTIQELGFLFKYVVEASNNAMVIIVIFVAPGRLYCNTINALYNLMEVQIHLEFGSYERSDGFATPGRYFQNEIEQIIFAGVSHRSKPDWKKIFYSKSANYSFDEEYDRDYVTNGWKTKASRIPDSESGIEKERRLKREAYMTLKRRAPRYSSVGEIGDLVNPSCKPGRILLDIIEDYSGPGDTVLDFFSGGSVLKSCFLLGRECFIYSDSRKELEFVKSYARSLRSVPTVEKFWDQIRGRASERNREHSQLEHVGDDSMDLDPIDTAI